MNFKVYIDHAPLMLQSAGTLVAYGGDLFVVLDGDEPDGKINCRRVGFVVTSGRYVWRQYPDDITSFDKTTVVDAVELSQCE